MINQATDFLLRKKLAAKKMGCSERTLDKKAKDDPDFPRPVKMGTTRQAAVYFSNKALDDYIARHNNKALN